MAYRNPTPVVVGLISPKPTELVLVRRNIEPFIGQEALPSGYVEYGEDWREALRREIEEEALIVVSTKPEHMSPYDVLSTPDGAVILIFAVIQPAGVLRVDPFKPTNETSERSIVSIGNKYMATPKLCFPLHTQVVERYSEEISKRYPLIESW